jgi:hypothetical protein
MVSRRSRSVVRDPDDFFSLRKTIGDRRWLEISSPGVPDSPAIKYIKGIKVGDHTTGSRHISWVAHLVPQVVK